MTMLAHRDLSRPTLHTQRSCFHWKTQYCILDTFVNAPEQPTILRTHWSSLKEDCELPPFVDMIKEVTENCKYSSFCLSKKASTVAEPVFKRKRVSKAAKPAIKAKSASAKPKAKASSPVKNVKKVSGPNGITKRAAKK
jgi:hypothetical protein